MNKKRQYQILLLVLITIVIFNIAIMLTANNNSANVYNVTTVGNNSYGTVYKIIAGNPSSNETIAIILGVHPREHEIHDAINQTMYNIAGENGAKNLTKRYVLYFIDVNDTFTSRGDTRTAGEALANEFIVPNIENDNPFVVIDVHEIDPIYEYSNFLFSLSNRTPQIDSYINKLSEDVDLVDFNFTEGTSPEKVTMPIADKGIPTILLEISITNDYSQKQDAANKLIASLDEIEP